MASLLILKAEVEDKIGSRMRMVFAGGMEAHLLAEEIGKKNIMYCEHARISNGYTGNANVGVILNPARPFPMVWDQRRMLDPSMLYILFTTRLMDDVSLVCPVHHSQTTRH